MSNAASQPVPAGYQTPQAGRDAVVIRFAGDSGDGMMLAGLRFAAAAAQAGNDVQLLPLPPSEIRAPAGVGAAVSAYQVHFGSQRLFTSGDSVDALIAMNPASLKLHLPDLAPSGLLIINSDGFDAAELGKAGYAVNPLDDNSLAAYRVAPVAIHRLNRDALASVKLLAPREVDRSRNLFALGLACWFFSRPLEPTLRWIRDKFAKNPVVVEANTRALQAGFDHGNHLNSEQMTVAAMPRTPGKYRRVSGHEALSLGLAAAAQQLKRPLVFAAYPMVPATELQQQIFDLRGSGIQAVQAEDEMAAAGMALGAAFAGGVGVTVTTGPGLCLMGETLGLAIVSELPLIVVDVMRAGAGNGIPTTSDQADLLQALYGRNGDSPLVVLAPASPAEGFAVSLLAVRLAISAMSPVIILTDTHLGLASEIWKTPRLGDLPPIPESPTWIVPGTPGGEHRQTGLDTDDKGQVSADPLNHERMAARRIAKIDRLAAEVPLAEIIGPDEGDVLVVGWGSAAGAIRAAVIECHRRGVKVAAAIVTSLHPLPPNLETVLRRYRRVVVAELNVGQLAMILRARYGIVVEAFNKVQGRPFTIAELVKLIQSTA